KLGRYPVRGPPLIRDDAPRLRTLESPGHRGRARGRAPSAPGGRGGPAAAAVGGILAPRGALQGTDDRPSRCLCAFLVTGSPERGERQEQHAPQHGSPPAVPVGGSRAPRAAFTHLRPGSGGSGTERP